MKRFTRLAIMAGVMVAVLAMTPGVSEGFKGRADHALLCQSCGDTAIYCGLNLRKAYTLHISASGVGLGGAGTVRITFRDGDFITFDVPDGEAFSMTQALGGVPGVDDVVKITRTGGVESLMASLFREKGGKDPFDEELDGGDAEKDNFCLTEPGSDGSTSAAALFP